MSYFKEAWAQGSLPLGIIIMVLLTRMKASINLAGFLSFACASMISIVSNHRNILKACIYFVQVKLKLDNLISLNLTEYIYSSVHQNKLEENR